MTKLAETTFLDFRVFKLDFSVNNHFNNSGHATVRTEFKVRHETSDTRLKVYLTIYFNDQTAPFSIHLEGVGLFDLQRNFSKAELEMLIRSHCTTVMFPYMREVIADISRRAGFPPLQIPQVDFSQVFQQHCDEPSLHTLH